MSTQTVVVCEGFHDRAFLKGWLEASGWSSPPDHELRAYLDRRGKAEGGAFILYRDHDSGPWIRIVPGTRDPKRSTVWRNADLECRQNKQLDRLIVCVDADAELAAPDPTAARRQRFEEWTKGISSSVARELLCWHVPGVALALGLPTKHTLELVVCEAMRRAYPDRLAPVAAFLDSTPLATGESDGRVKEHAWAYMAKWYGEKGCDEFHQSIWRDARLKEALEQILHGFVSW